MQPKLYLVYTVYRHYKSQFSYRKTLSLAGYRWTTFQELWNAQYETLKNNLFRLTGLIRSMKENKWLTTQRILFIVWEPGGYT
jgi:hypothetical protein